MFQTLYDIEKATLKYGFLPFFSCGIEGFSIEENTPEYLWFSKDIDGPWEWKGPIIALGTAAYGKFFRGKAGFVSLQWLPHLINYRRKKLRLSKSSPEYKIYEAVCANESMLSNELKKECGYIAQRTTHLSQIEKAYLKANKQKKTHSAKSQFDSLVNKLQMSTYLVAADFEYSYTKQGDRYGWGRARYTTPELMYGDIELPKCSAKQSYELMVKHLSNMLSDAPIEAIRAFLE